MNIILIRIDLILKKKFSINARDEIPFVKKIKNIEYVEY